MGLFGKKSKPINLEAQFEAQRKEAISAKSKQCVVNGYRGSINGKTCNNYPMAHFRMHSGGNVRRTGVYRVLSGEIVIPAKFRKGLGHKRIVDLIAKKHQGPIPRIVKVGGSRGGRISKNGPMRLLKGDVVISRGQRKGLTFGQIINLIHG